MDQFTQWAVQRYRLPHLRIYEPGRLWTIDNWLAKYQSRLDSVAADWSACLSPVRHLESCRRDDQGLSAIPLRDRCLVLVPDRLVVVHIRDGGRIEQLVRARCAASTPELNRGIELAVGNGLIKPWLRDELRGLGCRVWSPKYPERDADGPPELPCPSRSAQTSHDCPAWSRSQSGSWPFLSHWTRAPPGPWPDQSTQQYLDHLVLGSEAIHAKPFDTLCRIVLQQRLAASAAAIRGSTQVVCFTELHPFEIGSRRAFRSHRNRWDCEPYGICLRRSWLEKRGVRKVIYGDAETWQSLAPVDRPFYQRRFTDGRQATKQIDWITESEWRHVGDVDLAQVATDDAMLFVRTESEATRLRQISRWPVLSLEA